MTALYALAPMPMGDPMLASAIIYTDEDLDRTRKDLEAFVHDEEGTTPIDVKIVEGPAVGAIVSEATALPVDLIVLGTHGLSGFQHLMLGSVTERVLRKAPCAVLTVPPKTPDAGPVAFRQILCPVDFSPASLKALESAASLARESGARLTTMYVVEPLPLSEPLLLGGGGVANYEQEAVVASKARLHDIAPRGVELREVVTVGKPYQEILERAREDRTDLIAIGVHGGLADRLAFFGSTTNHIVREATCPVLSLRG